MTVAVTVPVARLIATSGLVTERVPLDGAQAVLERMTDFDTVGFALIDRF